ncbi:MAG: hypothetical protein K2K66_00385 [Ruminococcus sp.]|nr:hypothetical protein [Ruminococcus sp.]
MKKLLVFLTACIVICAFGSCSEKEESSVSETATNGNSVPEIATQEYDKSIDTTAFIGKWECTKFVKGGEEYTNVNGIPIYALFQYDLLEDGKINLADSLMEVAPPEVDMTYLWGAIGENQIEIASSDGNITFTMDNGQLISNTSDEEIYLDKVDEFQDFDFKAYYEQFSLNYSLVPVETDADGNVVSEGEPIPIK